MSSKQTNPIEAGCIRLVKLSAQGRLSPGDMIETKRLGICAVVTIHNTSTLSVCSATGDHFLLTGLNFGSNARMSR